MGINSNIKSLPYIHQTGEYGWECEVCGAKLWHLRWHGLKEWLLKLGAFSMQHDHPELNPPKEDAIWEDWHKCAEGFYPENRTTVMVRDVNKLQITAEYENETGKWRFAKPHALGAIVEWRYPASK